MGVAFIFNSSESNAQGAGPLPGNHVCCPSGDGCVDRMGKRWPDDETRTAKTCSQVIAP